MTTEPKTLTVYIDGPLNAQALGEVQAKIDDLDVKNVCMVALAAIAIQVSK